MTKSTERWVHEKGSMRQANERGQGRGNGVNEEGPKKRSQRRRANKKGPNKECLEGESLGIWGEEILHLGIAGLKALQHFLQG